MEQVNYDTCYVCGNAFITFREVGTDHSKECYIPQCTLHHVEATSRAGENFIQPSNISAC